MADINQVKQMWMVPGWSQAGPRLVPGWSQAGPRLVSVSEPYIYKLIIYANYIQSIHEAIAVSTNNKDPTFVILSGNKILHLYRK